MTRDDIEETTLDNFPKENPTCDQSQNVVEEIYNSFSSFSYNSS